MKCSDIERNLGHVVTGGMTPEQKDLVEEHLRSCPACCRLVAIARGDLEPRDMPASADLTRAVLSKTSGEACRGVRLELASHMQLEPGRGQMIAGHLEACSGCQEVDSILQEARRVLPTLSALESEVDLVPGILARTSGRRLPVQALEAAWISSVRLWWQWCLQRSRFTWEAAYVGTLLVVLVVGSPFGNMQNLAAGPLDSVQSRLIPGWQSTSETLSGQWRRAREKTSQLRRGWQEDLSVGRQVANHSLQWIRSTGSETREALNDRFYRLKRRGEAAWKSLGGQLSDARRDTREEFIP